MQEEALSLASDATANAGIPLCVDLDGTLLRSDMLLETLVAALRSAPWIAFLLPLWLLQGRANLKRELALRASIDWATLPYDAALLERLRAERSRGRKVFLATASDARVAEGISSHLHCFDGVFASDGVRNLKGEAKARALVAAFGERGFDYAGAGRDDRPVWRHAREAIVVRRTAGRAAIWLRALRVHQWAKNILVLVPIVTAHQLDPAAFSAGGIAFIAFSLAASGVYLLNDLMDLGSDRQHPVKRQRPLASGQVSIAAAALLAPVLLASAVLVASSLPRPVVGLLAAYIGINLFYSLGLKRLALVDVVILGGLYTLRIVAGAAAIRVPLSQWLLGFSLFAFLSLALAKRYVEVAHVQPPGSASRRAYRAGDAPVLSSLGIGAACVAVLVLALYVTSPQVTMLYRNPALLWFMVPLMLYWLARMWLLAHRGELHEDPVLFALQDKASYAVGALVAMVMFAAT
jgi:4-hydroxybenzoate polyprenyltransferase